MARRLNEFHWTGTTLGSPHEWPTELLAAVHLALDSRIPMMIGWGPDLHLIYNDGYIPILGRKHPAVWEPAAEVFAELWHHVGPLLEGVYRSGEAIKRENELLPMDRQGFLEEGYFTFSYSPLRDRHGALAGLVSTAVETTPEVIGFRRERLLRDLGRPLEPMDPEEAVRWACGVLEGAPDLAFHALVVPGEGGTTRILCSHGVTVLPPSSRAAASQADDVPRSWPLDRVAPGEPLRVPLTDLPGLQPEVGESVELPGHAAVVRMDLDSRTAEGGGDAFLVAGLSPALPWDHGYIDFVRRIGERLATQHNQQRLRILRLEEAEDRYHQLFLQALDGIILGRPSGEILAANPAACRILGYTEAELQAGGRTLVLDPDDPRWTDAMHKRRTEGSFTGELTWLHKSGKRVTCEVTSSLFPDPDGELRSTVILRDISDRLLLQAQLAEAQKMEVVGRISGGIAHDFNNLLAVIDVQTDLLRDELADRPSALDDLDLLRQTSHRAAALIRRLLDFTRHSHEEPRTFNPAITVTEMAPILRRMTGSGCELSFDLEGGAPDVRMPPHQFEQIVMNLVVNARDAVEATGKSGEVRVGIRSGSDRTAVVLTVSDDGIGIAEDALPQLFTPFYTTKAHGTGIGLHTVRLLTEQLGGHLTVESEAGTGSAFTVRIPAADDTTEAEDGPDAVAPSSARLDGVHVLLVEDQAHLRNVLARVLRRAGAAVSTASNGEEALRIARKAPPQVLVSDIVMPLLSGPELVRHLRRESLGPAIVLMSGYTGDEVMTDHPFTNARFLHKPFAAEALVRAVLEALSDSA